MFRNDLLNELISKNVRTKHLDSFKATAQYVLERHAPLKEKHVRCNQDANVKHVRCKFNKFRHGKTKSHAAYKKQRNIYVKLLQKN